MTFTDPELQKCFDSSLAATAGLPVGQREVSALVEIHDLFQMMEGPHSLRVHEVIRHLLDPGLRPELRGWFLQPEKIQDRLSIRFRDQLGRQAGEVFGGTGSEK